MEEDLQQDTHLTPFIKRDVNGLIIGLDYKFKDQYPFKAVDWAKMFLPVHLYPKPQRTKAIAAMLGRPIEEIPISEIPDSDLISTLPGARYLAMVRGYTKIESKIIQYSQDYVLASCTIDFTPNFEAPMGASFTACASATTGNTNSFGQKYLAEIAENRAFARCIRNFLNISIVSKEELSDENTSAADSEQNTSSPVPIQNTNPVELVKAKLKERGLVNWAQTKKHLGQFDTPFVEKILQKKTLDELSPLEALELMQFISENK